ncbi:selenocysteine-specific translation elongation factor [Nesterenkonia lacusekhoensis]|uniref:Selenocysteine-specific elongation factor n=1 Tax=Nesterenkonia lacusekhoensis TaxID=150832 RepID=A0ABS4T2J5_9MICC|nr:selenocysteine-specific translation elongation factor [Nesterenkonia lacusekhoensis]MBP2318113.1 selenocysteine-specific elongation factor [Nesterenkonia lacusekhoensis]
MYVVATAGHVDHGKSTLVRAFTGTEPDRWDEEHRRGLTIDLGFAATTLPSGRGVSFVDVPGHERFLGNMLSGLGPAPVVCFVVAADQGWQAQSSDHRDAVAALGVDTGMIVITRTDLAPDRVTDVLAEAREELAGTALQNAPAVAVSAATGEGLDPLRSTLDEVLSAAETPAVDGPIRLWVDRAFSLRGAGTVVTGTLAAGRLEREQRLHLLGADVDAPVTVRGLQSHGQDAAAVRAANRVAINLRGISAEQLSRGDVLLTPDAWHLTDALDVRHASGQDFSQTPQSVTVHIGTAAVAARCRPFDDDHARLTLSRPLPLRVGDRLLVRSSGRRTVLAGAQVLDADVPPLTRRGDGARRRQTLAQMSSSGELSDEVRRRRAVTEEHLVRMGIPVPEALPSAVRRWGGWLVDADQASAWMRRLRTATEAHLHEHPLSAGLSQGAAADALKLPDPALLGPVIHEAGLHQSAGRIRTGDGPRDLGAAEASLSVLEQELKERPFSAPEADRLRELGLHDRELAAAERQGRLLRLPGGVVLLPSSPARAMRELTSLEQPFTVSAARQALGTSRRVAVPLLEHLDARGWTRRVDSALREVVV